ncbi:MAG: thioredoxin [Candidatus Gracilibacteria bacterium]|jgi:thioredoxin 1|nr:thioredoxin [Candidatus Gracilibacteria bacterium]
MAIAKEIKGNDFQNEVLKSEIPVLVDFYAPWCMPCKMMAPILDELSGEMEGEVKILKVNTEEPENMLLSMTYQIQSIPNMKLFKNGEMIKDFVGMRSKDQLKEEIKSAV